MKKKTKEDLWTKLRYKKLKRFKEENDIWSMYYAGLISMREAGKKVKELKF